MKRHIGLHPTHLELAFRGRDPKVRRARVRDDLKWLRRRAELDIDVVLRIHEVVYVDGSGSRKPTRGGHLLRKGWVVSDHVRKAYIVQYIGNQARRFDSDNDATGTPMQNDQQYPMIEL